MPIQAPSWTDFLSCPICCNEFADKQRLPISLGCGHTICRQCLATLHNCQCPFDQTSNTTDVEELPINAAILKLVSSNNNNVNSSTGSTTDGDSSGPGNTDKNSSNESGGCGSGSDSESSANDIHLPPSICQLSPHDINMYKTSQKCIEELALHLKPLVANNGNFSSVLSRPMQRKLVTLINCQLVVVEGRVRVLRAARSLGERTVTELLLQHQNPQQLSSNLWAAVRARGCQFLGPSMQEEVLKLVLQALQDGSALSRKVLVMFVVQRLEPRFPQASKTSIGHVVQLLYRASCFKVSKREADSSLMQLKEEFRTYDALRREHDAQIVQIATESGLRIAPDQWSALLYGDTVHKSHMQSIIDKLQTPYSFAFSVQELVIALQRTGDPTNLSNLNQALRNLASIDPSAENPRPTWSEVGKALISVRKAVDGLVEFLQHYGNRKLQECASGQNNSNSKYKISLCRDLTVRRNCPRGPSCTFAHSEEELERYRSKNRKGMKSSGTGMGGMGSLSNVSNMNKDFPPLGQNHGHSHHSPHSPGLLHPGNNTSATTTTTKATSPMRFGGPPVHTKLTRCGYGEAISPLNPHGPPSTSTHHHIKPIPHNPIRPNNGPPISVPPPHRFDAQGFNTFNYPSSPSAVPPRMPYVMASVNTSPRTLQNVSGGIQSPRNFPTGLQSPQHHSIKQSLTNINPPKFQNNTIPNAIGSPLNSKNMYSLTPEFYTSAMRPPPLFNNNHNNSMGSNGSSAASNNGNSGLVGYTTSLDNVANLRPPKINHLWDQQLIGSSSTVAEMLNGAAGPRNTPSNHNSIYGPNDTSSLFSKKANNLNMELNKTINGIDIDDGYMFKSNFSSSKSCFPLNIVPTAISNKDTVLCGGLQAPRSSFWNTHGVGEAGAPTSVSGNPQDTNSIMHCINLGAPATTNFRDRDTFVRSDSILDDDAATYDVPVTSATMGSKFGPICPMYKGQRGTTTIASSTNTYLDSWSNLDGSPSCNKNVNNEHPLLEQNSSGDMNFSVFSNETEDNGRLQLHQQLQRSASGTQQQQWLHEHQMLSSAFDSFAFQPSLLSDFNHIKNMSGASTACDSGNYDLSLNTLQSLSAGVDDNANIDMSKSTTLQELLWNKELKSIKKIWSDRKQQQQQQKQQHQQQQLPRLNSKALNVEEDNDDDARLRYLEQEVSKGVAKVRQDKHFVQFLWNQQQQQQQQKQQQLPHLNSEERNVEEDAGNEAILEQEISKRVANLRPEKEFEPLLWSQQQQQQQQLQKQQQQKLPRLNSEALNVEEVVDDDARLRYLKQEVAKRVAKLTQEKDFVPFLWNQHQQLQKQQQQLPRLNNKALNVEEDTDDEAILEQEVSKEVAKLIQQQKKQLPRLNSKVLNVGEDADNDSRHLYLEQEVSKRVTNLRQGKDFVPFLCQQQQQQQQQQKEKQQQVLHLNSKEDNDNEAILGQEISKRVAKKAYEKDYDPLPW